MKIKLKYNGVNANGEPRVFEKEINSKRELEHFLTYEVKLTSYSK